MGFKSVELQLTDDQLAEINAAIGDNDQPFALLGHPQVRGLRSGTMLVCICTAQQYKAIDKGVIDARSMEAFQ
jgi:hypothetical protein